MKDNTIAKQLAAIALSIGAIELRPKNPFKWASKTYNPIYNDNRMLLGDFEHYSLVANGLLEIIKKKEVTPEILCATSLSGIAPAVALQITMGNVGLPKPTLVIFNEEEDLLYSADFSGYDPNFAGGEVDTIGASAPWAIPFGMRTAFLQKKPFMYMRPKQKDHGKKKIIEGNPKGGQSVKFFTHAFGEELEVMHAILISEGLSCTWKIGAKKETIWQPIKSLSGKRTTVIEDLVSTGGSALKEVVACRESGAEVSGVISIFNYGLDSAKKAFEEANCPVWSVLTYDTLLEVAKEKGMFSEEELELLADWRKDQPNWGAKNGFPPEEKK